MVEDKDVRFHLNLFQRWQLISGESEVYVASRQQRLIAALALYGARNRRYICGLLWPDSPEARALESLRVTMHLISRQIPGLLVNGGPVLSLAPSLSVDLHNCLEQVRGCQTSISYTPDDACLSHLRHAELLPGWYDDWVILEQNRLRTFRLRALAGHAQRWLDREEPEKAAEAARSALELEPLQEACVGLLMRAELELGNRVGAVHTFESFKASLATELGVAPSAYLYQLVAGIRGPVRS
ncbi:BTAD domain-containing putative transcriptional regulator [Arthrobacter sp. NPDC057009]|uniref:AfsR/SARP family transcriptional regulator n=1 Tax=Arthrobacter sp. NPDC057009 TaxID=3345996 RepID=UPI003645D54C